MSTAIQVSQRRYYDAAEKRMIYLHETADSDFWDRNWGDQFPTREALLSWNDSLWANITKEFLKPDSGPVLEGGCGMGMHVAALKNLGYHSVGVDFAERTVATLNQIVPELEVVCGDVRALPFPDGMFAGYWSLGVIEHFWNGYQAIAQEMYRVLKPGGFLFLVYPYMNAVRRWKSRLRLVPRWNAPSDASFYQFALNPKAVQVEFEALGFHFRESRPVMGRQGLSEEAPWLSNRIEGFVYKSQSRNVAARVVRRMLHEVVSRLLPYFSYSLLQVYQK